MQTKSEIERSIEEYKVDILNAPQSSRANMRKKLAEMKKELTKLSKPNKNLFYIGERHNPQFKKPYYKLYSQPSKKDAKSKENCAYGSMYLTSYNTVEEYNATIVNLRDSGYSIH